MNRVIKSDKLNIIDDLKTDYPSCFDNTGKFPGTLNITLDVKIFPAIHPPHNCPIHIKDELLEEVNKMEELFQKIQKMDHRTYRLC